MRRGFAHFGATIGGMFSLLRLAAQMRFRFRGAYWRWRHETAFGGGEPHPREKRRMILDYARWLWRMRRYR